MVESCEPNEVFTALTATVAPVNHQSVDVGEEPCRTSDLDEDIACLYQLSLVLDNDHEPAPENNPISLKQLTIRITLPTFIKDNDGTGITRASIVYIWQQITRLDFIMASHSLARQSLPFLSICSQSSGFMRFLWLVQART